MATLYDGLVAACMKCSRHFSLEAHRFISALALLLFCFVHMSQPEPKRACSSSPAVCNAPSPPNPHNVDAETAARSLLRAIASADRDSLHTQLASALVTDDSSVADDDKLDAHARNRFASSIIAALLQTRMRDPFARLPDDIVQMVLEFFHPFCVASFRGVCRRWRDAGNIALSRTRFVDLFPPDMMAFYGDRDESDADHDLRRKERRAFAIRLMAARCRCVETLALVVDNNTHGFTEQEVVMALASMPSIKALFIVSRHGYTGFDDIKPVMSMLPFRGMRPFCSGMRVLTIGGCACRSLLHAFALHDVGDMYHVARESSYESVCECVRVREDHLSRFIYGSSKVRDAPFPLAFNTQFPNSHIS